MTLLEDIQNDAVDSSVELATLLRKCKLLSARLDSRQLEEWVTLESNGYPANVAVPDYRVWPLIVKGHFAGPFGSGIRNAPIPYATLPAEVGERYSKYEYRGSVASAEAALDGIDGPIQVSTGDLALVLGMKVYQGQNCVQAWAEFSPHHLIELLNTVRNRVLDFAVAVWKESPGAADVDPAKGKALKPERVTQIFNTTVYGGSANLVGSAVSSSISFAIKQLDIESLERALLSQGVGASDVEELKSVVALEPAPVDKKFGPRVSHWIGAMVSKAANGTWDVGVTAAGTILAEAIAKYYGF
jgi:hypothetical protein